MVLPDSGPAEHPTSALTPQKDEANLENVEDWSAVNLYDMPGDSTWPIVLVSYLYVKKDQSSTNPKTAAALQATEQRGVVLKGLV